MKKTLFLVAILFSVSYMEAQDIIVLHDATEIEASVLEITDSLITYRSYKDPNGPILVQNCTDVFYIKFHNGTKEIFRTDKSEPDTLATGYMQGNHPNKRKAKKMIKRQNPTWIFNHSRPFVQKPMFDGYSELYGLYISTFNFGMDVSLGCRISDHLYAGIQLGLAYISYHSGYFSSSRIPQLAIPIRMELRTFFPINRNVHPHLNLAFGFGPLINPYDEVRLTTYYRVGFGFDFKRFTLGFGFGVPERICLRMGVRMGKKL